MGWKGQANPTPTITFLMLQHATYSSGLISRTKCTMDLYISTKVNNYLARTNIHDAMIPVYILSLVPLPNNKDFSTLTS